MWAYERQAQAPICMSSLTSQAEYKQPSLAHLYTFMIVQSCLGPDSSARVRRCWEPLKDIAGTFQSSPSHSQLIEEGRPLQYARLRQSHFCDEGFELVHTHSCAAHAATATGDIEVTPVQRSCCTEYA